MSIILKFGGTSVGNSRAIAQAVKIIKKSALLRPVIVVSALAHITNMLLATADLAAQGKRKEVLKNMADIAAKHAQAMRGLKKNIAEKTGEKIYNLLQKLQELYTYITINRAVSKCDRDEAASFGERMSSWVLAGTLENAGIKAIRIDSRELVATDSDFGGAAVDFPLTEKLFAKKITPMIGRGIVPVITGFIGRDSRGRTTTLGRGGSDYTAAIAAISLGAKEIQIWKDVKGFMTADPRVVPRARVIQQLTFNEAAELAYFGAKVLHPKTIHPAVKKNIPVRILNTFEPSDPGTLICADDEKRPAYCGITPVQAIAYKRGITVINVCSLRMLGPYGFLEKLFGIFSSHRVPVDCVATSEVNVSMTIEDEALSPGLIKDLEKIGRATVRRGHAILSLVGKCLKYDSRVEANIFAALNAARIPTEMISKGASAINFTCIIEEKYCEKAVKLLHKKFWK